MEKRNLTKQFVTTAGPTTPPTMFLSTFALYMHLFDDEQQRPAVSHSVKWLIRQEATSPTQDTRPRLLYARMIRADDAYLWLQRRPYRGQQQRVWPCDVFLLLAASRVRPSLSIISKSSVETMGFV